MTLVIGDSFAKCLKAQGEFIKRKQQADFYAQTNAQALINSQREINEVEGKRMDELHEGIKHDAGKTRYDLIDWPFVEGIAEVLTLGADKYSDDNWKRVKPFRSRYIGAAMRHFVAWICGERLDKESGLSHLYHLGCCIMFLAWGDKDGE